MPVLFKLLLPVVLFFAFVSDLVPLIMIGVIYAIAFIFVALPLFSERKKTAEQAEFKGYMYLTAHLLLYLLTFGVWQLVWVYRTTKNMNEFTGDNRMSPSANVVLSLFMPFYTIYWSYKMSLRVDEYAKQHNIRSTISSSCLIFAPIFDIVAALLIQNKINEAVCARVHLQKGDVVEVASQNGFDVNRYYNIEKHIALCIASLGIWNYIWIYRTTKALNEVEGEMYRGPVKKLLLCIFVPFYIFYWYYITAKRIDEITMRFGIDSDTAVVSVVSAVLFGGIIPSVILQNKVNESVVVAHNLNSADNLLCDKYDKNVTVNENQVRYIPYFGIISYILLCIVTIGIWHFVWIWRATEVTNAVTSKKQRSQVCQLLLCLFVPFYMIAWTYQTTRRIDAFSQYYGVNSDLTAACTVCAVLLPIIAPIIMQDKINEALRSANGEKGTDNTKVDTYILAKYGRRSVIFHLFMYLFLGFIWQFIWNYKITKATNALIDCQERDAVEQLLLCLVVPFYSFYWLYKTVQRIDKISGITGNRTSITAASVCFNAISGVFATLLMQHKLNEICAEIENK